MDPIRRSTREALQRCGLEAFCVQEEDTVVLCRRGDSPRLSPQFSQKALIVQPPPSKRSAPRRLDFVVFFVSSSQDSAQAASMVLFKMSPSFARYDGAAVWLRRAWLTETDVEAAASRLVN
jgi:hypothetical protein